MINTLSSPIDQEGLTLSLYTNGIDLLTFTRFHIDVIEAITLYSSYHEADLERCIDHLTPHLVQLTTLINEEEALNSSIDDINEAIVNLPISMIIIKNNIVITQTALAQKQIENNQPNTICNNTILKHSELWKFIVLNKHTEARHDAEKTQYFFIPLTDSPKNNSVFGCLFIQPKDEITTDNTLEAEAISSFFGLTRRESEIANTWSKSPDISDAAKLLRLKENSLRQSLKHIREKLGVNDQKDRLTLLLRSTPIAHHRIHRRNNENAFDNTITLPNNRTLSYRGIGPIEGYPVLYLHSMFGSRKEQMVEENYLFKHNIRLIIPERPGFGKSSANKHGSLRSTTDDLIYLIDSLGVDHFSIIGYSVGCSYATLLAAYYGSQVNQLIMVSCMPPGQFCFPDKQRFLDLFSVGKWVHDRSPSFLKMMIKLLYKGDPRMQLQRQLDSPPSLYALHPKDVAYFSQPQNFENYVQSFIEALTQGSDAIAQELNYIYQENEEHLYNISTPTYLWHGEDDSMTSSLRLPALSAMLPLRTVHRIEGETHNLFFRKAEAIFDDLII
ncbi:hypothetical protein A9Q99_21900 [Gammaproteobacteria bacterium 45_16_T64]|nr:hypothetical protein A9Q99_21900 [Gammaproteobacteria bacterium 45_16_T64]